MKSISLTNLVRKFSYNLVGPASRFGQECLEVGWGGVEKGRRKSTKRRFPFHTAETSQQTLSHRNMLIHSFPTVFTLFAKRPRNPFVTFHFLVFVSPKVKGDLFNNFNEILPVKCRVPYKAQLP